jgi:hypothetical protein
LAEWKGLSGVRALRHAVIWRKLSFGTQSAGDSRFVETMLMVIGVNKDISYALTIIRVAMATVAGGLHKSIKRCRC